MDNEKEILDSINLNDISHEEVGDDHLTSSIETPMRSDAFDLSDREKIEIIRDHFKAIMVTLGLDTDDESLRGTPYRVAKMYVNEIFSGLNPDNKPVAKKFANKYEYGDMVVEKNIQVTSFCEHHFLPFTGKAHVAYISRGKVIGLSKINRIVDFFSRRPQVQERLTLQVANELQKVLETKDVAVFIESKHLCVSMRGIQDTTSSTITSEFQGAFRKSDIQRKFIDYIRIKTEM
ncbi:MAG: GTP cyclohydrolase I FolE [Balneolaceae bacterium]